MDGGNKPVAAAAGAAGEVARLIAAGKCKQAVELAKDEHKRRNTPETESLLVDAYLSRIDQFQKKGAAQDAQTLLNLVRERFPKHRGRLAQLEAKSAAIEGRVDVLVAPLVQADISPELRTAIETDIRQHLLNLPALAACRTLPEEHPLRVAAAAVWKAFAAVTAGPVSDEQVALAEVSRRSPLASWKMLVRAIAAFYRNDDEACRRAMEGIEPDAAVRRLVPTLTAIIDGRAAEGPMAGTLQSRIGGDVRPVRNGLEQIEKALERRDLFSLRRWVRVTIQALSQLPPDVDERVRQHLFARFMAEDLPIDEVVRQLGTVVRRAHFWRLLARETEGRGNPVLAAVFWTLFLRHAAHEGMFKAGGQEEAILRLHVAKLLTRLSPEDLEDRRFSLRHGKLIRNLYKAQPPDVAALAPNSDREIVDEALDPGRLYARAAEIRPDAETMQQWWAWGEKAGLSDREKEGIAETWHRKRPGDPQPLLFLSAMAEDRNAFSKALKYLSAAEAIDSLNPEVRRARVRLVLGTTWRHFRERKAHLVEKDLAELSSLPTMNEADRGAFLLALRAGWHVLRREKPAADDVAAKLVERVGPVAAELMLRSVACGAKLENDLNRPVIPAVALPDARAAVETEARLLRLGRDLNFQVWLPKAWNGLIDQVLQQRPCPLSEADMLIMGKAALSLRQPEQAYLASSAGLSVASGPATARFLVLRAKSFPFWAEQRASQCLRAALELAQQAHNAELMEEVSAAVDEHPMTRQALAYSGRRGLGEELLLEVLKNEREAQSFPRNMREADRYLVAIESPRAFIEPPIDLGMDEDEAEEDEGFFDEGVGPFDEEEEPFDEDTGDLGAGEGLLPAGLPPEALPVILKIVDKFGHLPSPQELMGKDPQLAAELAAIIAGLSPEDVKGILDLGPPPFFGGRRRKKKRRK